MDCFRLTWGVRNRTMRNIHDCDNRFEVIGSREAIFDLWFHLSELEKLADKQLHESACPRCLTIFDMNSIPQEPHRGLHGLVHDSTFQ